MQTTPERAYYYWLRKPRCPCDCCEGEGFIIILCCPNCGTLFGGCDEVESLIVDLHAPKEFSEPYRIESVLCPACHRAKYTDFVWATLDEIRGAGFSESDVQRWPS